MATPLGGGLVGGVLGGYAHFFCGLGCWFFLWVVATRLVFGLLTAMIPPFWFGRERLRPLILNGI